MILLIDGIYCLGNIYKNYLKSSRPKSLLCITSLDVNEQLSFIEWVVQIIFLDLYNLIILEESILLANKSNYNYEKSEFKDLSMSYKTMKDIINSKLHQSIKKYFSGS